MEKFSVHEGTAAPLRHSNVDTDQIIPGIISKRISRSGFEDGLFAAWRRDPDFVLNQPHHADVSVLVARPDLEQAHPGTCRVGVAELRFQGRDLGAVRGHLPE